MDQRCLLSSLHASLSESQSVNFCPAATQPVYQIAANWCSWRIVSISPEKRLQYFLVEKKFWYCWNLWLALLNFDLFFSTGSKNLPSRSANYFIGLRLWVPNSPTHFTNSQSVLKVCVIVIIHILKILFQHFRIIYFFNAARVSVIVQDT